MSTRVTSQDRSARSGWTGFSEHVLFGPYPGSLPSGPQHLLLSELEVVWLMGLRLPSPILVRFQDTPHGPSMGYRCSIHFMKSPV